MKLAQNRKGEELLNELKRLSPSITTIEDYMTAISLLVKITGIGHLGPDSNNDNASAPRVLALSLCHLVIVSSLCLPTKFAQRNETRTIIL